MFRIALKPRSPWSWSAVPSIFIPSFLPVNVGKNVGEDLEDDELEVLRHFGRVDADGLEDEDEVDGRPADREHHDHHQHQLSHSPLVPADGWQIVSRYDDMTMVK